MVIASFVALFCFLVVIWYFDPLFAWLLKIFASSPSEEFPPESRECSHAFFIGASDQRVISIKIEKKCILIAVEKDIDTIEDVEGEMLALCTLTKEIWGTLTPSAAAFLERHRKKVSELVTALATANIRASKAEDAEARARQHVESVKNQRDEYQKKFSDSQNEIASMTMQIRGLRAAMAELNTRHDNHDRIVQRHIQKSDLLMRWFDKMKEAYKQKRRTLMGVEYELAHRRQEVLDMREDRLQLSELLLSMGQRIVKQAESLAKKAEKV